MKPSRYHIRLLCSVMEVHSFNVDKMLAQYKSAMRAGIKCSKTEHKSVGMRFFATGKFWNENRDWVL